MQQQLGYKTMKKNGKTAMIVAITLGVLGTASAAFAGGAKNDDGAGHDRWEGKIGPLGQVFSSGQIGWISQPGNAFAQSHAHTYIDHGHRKISRY
jgi:hypothetical protein